jgi:hypothetical protein
MTDKKPNKGKGMRGSEVSPGERKKKREGFTWFRYRPVSTKSGIGTDAGTSKGMRGSEKKVVKKRKPNQRKPLKLATATVDYHSRNKDG